MVSRRLMGLVLATLILGSASWARADNEGWTVSFTEAQEQAAEEGKVILMEFTGSDWCPPCIALHDTVLSTDTFQERVPEHFVLLKLDNPRDKSNQSEEEQEQYRQLSARYSVSGVPTIFLADAEGRPFARMVGYGGTAADEYIDGLIEKKDALEQRNELFAQAEEAEGAEKARLLHEALEFLAGAIGSEGEDVSALVVNLYEDTARQIIEADAENEAGLREAYTSRLAKAEIQGRLQEIVAGFEPTNIEGSLEQVDGLLEEFEPTGENLQEILYVKSLLIYRSGDKAQAKDLLESAQKAAPESAKAEEIQGILDTVDFED